MFASMMDNPKHPIDNMDNHPNFPLHIYNIMEKKISAKIRAATNHDACPKQIDWIILIISISFP